MKDLKMNLHFLKHFFGPFWDDSVLRHYMYTIIEKNNTFFIHTDSTQCSGTNTLG